MTSKADLFSSSIPSFAKALERALNPYEDRQVRVPFVLHSTWRQKRGISPLVMKMNPSTVTFSQSKRTSERKTQAGSVFFHWTNVRGENNDVLQVEFSGQTGNINLRSGVNNQSWLGDKVGKVNDWLNETFGDDPEAPEGALGLEPTGVARDLSGASRLANFWNLHALTTEPILDVMDGTANVSFIQFSSPLFGNSSIRLEGHFSRVLDIADDATNPFNKNYSFGFTAIATSPSVTQIYNSVVNNLGALLAGVE